MATPKTIQKIGKKPGNLKRCFAITFLSVLSALPVPQLWAKENPLVLGVFPRRNATLTFEMFSPMAKYLSESLGRPVKLETSANFKDFWKGVSTLRYDIVHYNQYHYIRSHKKLGYEVIAMNEEFGRATIAGAIAVRADSGISQITELKGTKIVFGGGPKAMMSYIMPTYVLRKAGLKAGEYREDFAKSPPNAILSTYFKQSKAAGIGDIVLKLPSVKTICNTKKLTELAVSESVAHLPWAVKGEMSENEKLKIQTVLTGMHESNKGKSVLEAAGLTNLLIAKDQDYERHREITFDVLGERY